MDRIECFDAEVGIWNFRIYRIFVLPERLCFVHSSNSVVSMDANVLPSLQGLTPEQMIECRPRSYVMPFEQMLNHEFVVEPSGISWRFKTTDGRKHGLVLSAFGDPVATVAIMYRLFGKSLKTLPRGKEATRILKAVSAREQSLPSLGIETESKEGSQPATFDPLCAPPVRAKWDNPRAMFFTLLLVVGSITGAILRGCGS